MNKSENKTEWKRKVIREMTEYWINVLYLALFFGVFTLYRRLILAHYQISYFEYGVSIIKALVLAKVIMLGNVLRIGQGFKEMPLIVPTVFRAFIFSIWVGLFTILEHTVAGLIHGKGLVGGFYELLVHGRYELVANSLVVFFAFIPFFAVKELGQVVGEGKLFKVFFRRRFAMKSDIETNQV